MNMAIFKCERCGAELLQTRPGIKLPEDWMWEPEYGYLCPECASEWRKLMKLGPKKEK